MKTRTVVCSLVAVALVIGLRGQVRADFFPWWEFDSTIEAVQERGSLRVGVGLFAPWVMCDTRGGLIGFEVDIARSVAGDLLVDVEFVPTNWHYVIPALIAQEFDVIISGMSITPARSLRVNFTNPYNQTGVYLVANTEKTAAFTTLQDYDDPQARLATLRGSSVIEFMGQTFPQAEVVLFDTETAVLRAVVSGDVHAAAASPTTRHTWVAGHPEALHLPFAEPFASDVTAIGVRKGDLDTLNFFNSWIAIHRADGWLEQRRRHWFEGREWAGRVATDPAVIAACEEEFQ